MKRKVVVVKSVIASFDGLGTPIWVPAESCGCPVYDFEPSNTVLWQHCDRCSAEMADPEIRRLRKEVYNDWFDRQPEWVVCREPVEVTACGCDSLQSDCC